MSRLRDIAFGHAPGAPVRVPRDAPPRDRWLAAVALGGQGRYAAAAAELARLRADPATPAAVRAHAAVTAASHRRQLGGHAVALADDGWALRIATTAVEAPTAAATAAASVADEPDPDGTDLAAARVDALVGLAADNVGLGRPLVAQRLLDSAELLTCYHPSWRLPVRVGWVRAELALLRGDPGAALAPATDAVQRARAAGSVRHLVKSLIVRVVAAAAAGALDPEEAVSELDRLAGECAERGLAPLEWPCLLAAGDLLDRTGDAVNDVATRTVQHSRGGSVTGRAQRRHAAQVTMSVIARRSDPLGRRLLGVSMRSLGFHAVM
ncbi:hypothetical protein SAMN05443637_11610 [Pseudonocardia thermophila]|uniref:Uncharacterized protein n=1 Tax=Pseudonocardia thermophila TaxID=1848 RepID=A0A1M6X395_PSETH|nr:hypothetical protein [Pseudonocardia thermophila]SHL00408.1 hypothetical protein SAMN05443637_11610 [Pseudonocardia thermophila]